MKRLYLCLILSATFANAAGTVNQVSQQLGTSTTWALTLNWTGDATTGTVPSTLAKLPPEIGYGQGYRIVSAETAPGTVQPTANYNVMLTDSVGLDLLGGAAIGLSATAAQTFAGNSSAPIYGAFSLLITGNSVGGAKGSVIVYISPISAIVLSPGLIPPPVTPGLIPDTIIAGGSLAAQCAHAQGLNTKYSVAITKNWANVPTQHIPCTLVQAGGSITAGIGQVITYDGAPILTRQPLFNCGIGTTLNTINGMPVEQAGAILATNGYAVPEVFGAVGYANAPGPSGSVDSSFGFQCAAHSIPATGGTLDLGAGLTYYLKTAQTIQFPAFDFPVTHGTTLNGNGAALDITGMPGESQAFINSPTVAPAFQVSCPSNPTTCIAMSNVAIGATAITVSDGTKFAVGHEIYLQGGESGTGTEVNSELNVIVAISGNVLTLQTPTGKAYANPSPYGAGTEWPVMAWDVDALTVKNFTTENLTVVSGSDTEFSLLDIQSDGDTIRNVSLIGPGVNAYITGYNRHWTFDNFYAEVQPGKSCPPGGFIQISQSSSFVEIKNSTLNNQTDTSCPVGVNEGSFNVNFLNNNLYNTTFGLTTGTPAGVVTALNNNFTINGSVTILGVIENNCCGGIAPPLIASGNVIAITNQNAYPVILANASTFAGNTIVSNSATLAAVTVTSFTGGSITGNSITTDSSGIVVNGHPNFPITSNAITGGDTTGTAGILLLTSSNEPSGPIISANNITNFPTGVLANGNLAFFSGRAINANGFNGVTTPYSPAGLPVVSLSGTNGTEVSLLGCPYNSTFDPGLVVCGRLYSKSGSAGFSPTSDEIGVFEGIGNASAGIHAGGGGAATLYFRGASGAQAAASYNTATGALLISTDTAGSPGTPTTRLEIGSGGLQPVNTTSGYLSQDGTAGHTGSTCSAWKNGLCTAP